MLCHFGIHGIHLKVGQPVCRIYQPGYIVIPLYRLQKKQNGGYQHGLVAPVAGEEQHQSHYRKQQKDVSRREKGRVQRGESRQQHQTPEKAVSEILPALSLVVTLDIERETEQQGEYRVCLSGEKTKVAGTFAIEPFYFVSRKGDAVFMPRIDEAIRQIQITSPRFFSALFDSFLNVGSNVAITLSRGEGEWLASRPVLRMAYSREQERMDPRRGPFLQRLSQELARRKLIVRLGDEVKGPLPRQLLAENYFAEQRRFHLSLQAQKLSFDQFLAARGQTVEQLRAELHADAERKLRSRLGLLLVAEREHLWPGAAETDAALAAWDDKRDGQRTFPANDARKARQRLASARAEGFILARSTLLPPPAEPTVVETL